MTAAPVLRVDGLRVDYPTPRGELAAVDGIEFTVERGEILGLIGESGSGKTTTAMAILRLIQPPGRIGGHATLDGGTDLLALGEKELRRLRWRGMALIPQGALNALNPLLRVGDQLEDVILTHEGRGARKGLAERLDALYQTVGLPRRVGRHYPHELSGGMRQRVCIAMAIALDPPLVIADEPTSALDVIVQRVVAQTLLDVKRRLGIAFVLIGHDIGLMAQLADRVAVMYRGKIVEIGPTEELFASPRHPYTRMLIDAVPAIGHKATVKVAEGLAPDPFDQAPGCVFQRRCPYVFGPCRVAHPPLERAGTDHSVACYLLRDAAAPTEGASA
ncbi:MAG: ABC transporter ATP-binding protein [Gaiella sp.]|nr:ABC transporter ATP-binding protein [Gaiella sp.]